MKRQLIWAGLALALSVAGWNIWSNERILADGRVALLELAPVDPRSLMQGDYMALNYALANELRGGSDERRVDGYAIVRLDERGIAKLARQQPAAQPLAAGEIAIRYRVRDGQARIATNAFFFQEGRAQEFSAARYGEFRIGENGEPRLTALLDADFRPLGENRY